MAVHYIVISVLLSVCCVVCGQYVPPTPCPDVFSYKVEGQQAYGAIRFEPAGQLKYVFVRASFSIAAKLPSGYAGQLDVVGSKELALLKMLRGQALDYRVDFPLASPLPVLTSVAVNGHVLCTGEADSSGPSESFSLEHLLFDKGDVLSPLALNFGNTGQYSPVENTTPIPEPLGKPECGVVSGGNDQVGLVYGTAVSVGDWPWLVAVFTKRGSKIYYTCAGSLVSNQHVVTAAHCMSRKDIVRPLKDFVLKVGAFNLDYSDDPRVSVRGVKAAALHTNYNSHTLENDILILHLDAPVGFTKLVKPICLWEGQISQNLIIRKRGSVVGWGGNELRESGTGEPRMASIPVVSTETCRASRIEFHKLTSSGTTFCAGYRNGTGPCNGDSGSGMYILSEGRWSLRGVVSVSLRPVTGEAKCNLDEYVVFTDAAQYLPWLQQHLHGPQAWPEVPHTPQKTVPTNISMSSGVPCGVVSGGNDQVSLVYNGVDASPGDWPWLVAIYKRKKFELQFTCGGSLVSDQHVITAAHCGGHRLEAADVKDLLVKAGIFDLSAFSDDNVVTRGIKEVILHPEYDPVNFKNNIAIFKLEKRVVFTSYIRPICVPGIVLGLNSIIGKTGMAPGWGFNEEIIVGKGPTRVASAPVVSAETCLRSNSQFIQFLSGNTFCAGYRNGTAPCNGDSGGGLYMLEGGKWSLRGIISLALTTKASRCDVNEYIIYIDVAQHVPWLKEHLSEYWPQIAHPPETRRTPPEQCGVVSGGNERVPLIYNGVTASPGDWPWLVAIYARKQLEYQFICGGSLVSNQHVITAAHCQKVSSSVVELKDLLVKAGVYDISENTDSAVTRGVIQALLHPEYNDVNYKNNIAVMKLEYEVVFTAYIRPICLPETKPDLNSIIGKRGMVAGWGFTESSMWGGPPRVASAPIVTTEQCLRSHPNFFNLITDNTFCAGDRNGTLPCKGDSGGGLYLIEGGKWSLRGIISLAISSDAKCNTNEYVVYVDVAQYMPWLRTNLQQ